MHPIRFALALLPVLIVCAAKPAQADETVWLSSLDLTKATQGWGTPHADQSVDGHPITLAGKVFQHGFGTHSPGLLTIDLKGGARRFTATVGIDDEVGGGKGSAEFQVVDASGKVLWTSGVLRQGQEPKTVDVDLTGVPRIALRVTLGGDNFEFDHADWADARFIMASGRPETAKMPQRDIGISMAPASPRPEIHAPTRLGARAGAPFLWSVPASGRRPMRFSAQQMPKGLQIDEATGIIRGVVAKPGTYTFTVGASNSVGATVRTVDFVVGTTAMESIARTPPLGWNSYDCFGDDVVEDEVLANARYLREYMQPYGWDTVVVDYRWYDPGASTAPNNTGARAGADLTMDAYGRLLPSPNRFPSAAAAPGFKGLADAVHAMGLRFGIHIMRGIPRNAVKANLPIEGSDFKAADAANTGDTCGWCPDMYGVRGDTPAGRAYYDSLFRLYADWGVDYVKMDDTSSPYHTDEIEAVRGAIDKCGRAIVYSLSPGETPVDQAKHVAAHANLWRVSGDFWDDWNALSHEFELGRRWTAAVGAGHWPDADMLPVGHLSIHKRSVGADRRTHFTRNEQITLITLWSILPSPLMVGANLPDNDPWTLALLTNPEVMAVNQDALGAPGMPVTEPGSVEIWSRKLADGSVAVGIFNRDEFEQQATLDASKLGLTGRCNVRDLWLRKDAARRTDRYTVSVPAHAALLLKLTKAR